MNSVLAKTIDDYCPKFNTNVSDGTAKQILETIPEYYNKIIESSLKSLNPNVNLRYLGYRKMTPNEEFVYTLLSSNNKTNYDLAESYIYMAEYVFEYQGQKIVKPLYLPFSEDGNIMKVSNTQYHIIPVLSNTIITPSYNEVFVRLLKDKLIFKSMSKNFVLNNEVVPGRIIYTEIIKTNAMNITDYIGKPLTSIAIYILGEHGFKKTMLKYLNIEDYVITDQNVDHLRNDYNVFESTKLKPRSLKAKLYIPHDVKICISKKYKITPLLENILYGIIYTLDILPEDAADMVKVTNGKSIENEILYWRILLGKVVYKNSFTIERRASDINEHYDNLQGYVDNQIRAELSENKIYVKDFFDLLATILDNYNVWLINSKEYNSNIRNRYIDILYYIMYDMIVGFNKVILAINKRVSKKADLSLREISKLFTSELSTRKIFSIAKTSEPSLSLLTVDSSLDIKYPKITAILED